MGDYPDYTTLTQIVGTEVTIPISIESVAVVLDVDIVAQTVGNLAISIAASDITLNVDVTAQTIGNLAVNIAAAAITLNINIASSAVTLNVDITAQTIGELNIDITAQSVAIIDQPNWAVQTATDINLIGGSSNVAPGNLITLISYSVPAGKTLYITQYGIVEYSLAANVQCLVKNYTDNVYLCVGGGAQGMATILNKPIKVAAGKVVELYGSHFGATNGFLEAHIGGYLL